MDSQQKKTIGLTLLLTLTMLWLNIFFQHSTPKETAVEEVPATPLEQMRQTLQTRSALPKFDNVSLTNKELICHFSPQGANITNVQLKSHIKYTGENVQLLNEESSYMDFVLPCKNGEVIHVKDLVFDIETQTANHIAFLYNHYESEGESIRIEYTLDSHDYTLHRKVTLGDGWDITAPEIDFIWFNSLKNQEKHIGKSQRNTQICYLKKGTRSYFTGNKKVDKQQLALEQTDWFSFQQPFFLQSIITPKPANATILMAPFFSGDSLAHMAILLKMPTEELKKGSTTSFYFGPNTPSALHNVGKSFKKNHYYGPWIFGSVNKYFITPLAGTLSAYTDNFLPILFFIVLLLALLQFLFIYQTHINSIKLKAIKPFLEAIKGKGLSDSVQKMEEMNFYRKVGINPLVSLVPILFNLPIMFSMMNFVRYTIHFRGVPFLWIEDLASYDDFITLPFSIPYIGNHISLIAILATALIGAVNHIRKQPSTDESNQQLMTFGLPVMMLLALNSEPAAFWLYRTFRNVIEGLQQLIFRKIVDENLIIADIEKKANLVDTEEKIPRAQKRLENKLHKKKKK